ncbi:aminopeptidase [Arundinibacter roseus]|uniref:Aminopeptidase N n=1 Tax=Arundinibacter roseus TaxID=2070510 RepID=A0A4R4KDU0_9BACT|nr:aminopeptidase [Arundinibacter roseus]
MFTTLKYSLLLLFFGWVLAACRQSPVGSVLVEDGVSEALAQQRAAQLSDISYKLHFEIPAQKDSNIAAQAVVRFSRVASKADLQLDFRENAERLKKLRVNEKEVPIRFEKEHLLISANDLKTGVNAIEVDFLAGNSSLNRSEDFLYTLLVPDRARTVFPCFDQPDLKARFELSLTVPAHWNAMGNAPLRDSTRSDGQKTYNFRLSDLIPTYLFSFVAGEFFSWTRQINGREMTLLHRETDTTKLSLSLDPIFNTHAEALAFLEDYTQIKYPFQKFDFAAIPDFQYGGMEHVGAIQYKSASLFLDKGATKDQKLSRAKLLAHETAHMWFGDLVTMRWFNDVWMKEVFANFMADKITETTEANSNYELEFLVSHVPAAYEVDRTEGPNPIRQSLENLNQAGSMYGPIIYHKAPIMMRQLERLIGKDNLRDGLREYLKKYAFGNATWPDLIAILDARTPLDLAAWNHVWVNETGRPMIDFSLKKENGKIAELKLTQQAEDGSTRLWPQSVEVALVYPDRVEEIAVGMNAVSVAVPEAAGKPAPTFVLVNSSGQGYGLFSVDPAMLPNLATLPNALMRASAYISLYENMLSQKMVKPEDLLTNYIPLLIAEKEELNIRLLTGQLSSIFWQFIPSGQRPALATKLEVETRKAMQVQENPNIKKLLFKFYQSVTLSKVTQDELYTIWKTQKAPNGITLTEDDYTALALALAVRDYPEKALLEQQVERIKNPDRQKRLRFMIPALASDGEVRDAFFASLADDKNREREAWVSAALGYLHHPLRAERSVKYLPKSLELLEEIQKTGDIFFPQAWLNSTLGSYQTTEAVQVVRTFLAERSAYNPRLKGKLLQSADGLFRAELILKASKAD